MPKLFYMQFHTGDWLKKPKLRRCSAATKGVWIDLLCVMFENDQCGMVEGTFKQIGKPIGESAEDVAVALYELQQEGVADITPQLGLTEPAQIIRVISRRMRKEYLRRIAEKERKDKSIRENSGANNPQITRKEPEGELLNYDSNSNSDLLSLDLFGGVLPDLGQPETKTQGRLVDRWVRPALAVLRFLNERRQAVIEGAREIRPTYASLYGICGRLAVGRTVGECMAVVDGYATESASNEKTRKFFDAVSPFRQDNFQRMLDRVPEAQVKSFSNFSGPRAAVAETKDVEL